MRTKASQNFKLFVTTAIFLAAGLAFAAADLPEKEAIQKIEREVAKIIPEAQLPALYKYLNKIKDKLAAAQKEIQVSERKYVTTTQLLILDHAEPAAFVLTLEKGAVDSQRNLVAVSTGMLTLMQMCAEEVSANAGERTSKIWAVILSNILGHEFAHPKVGQDARLTGNKTSQSEEIVADRWGMDIARRAGFSSQGLLVGLKCIDRYVALIKQKDTTFRDAVAAGMGTHPQEVLRATHLRASLAMRKMLEAQTSNWNAEPVSPALVKEMIGLMEKQAASKPVQNPIQVAENPTLQQALEYFEKLQLEPYGPISSIGEANLWLLRLDYALSQLKQPLDEQSMDRVANAFKLMFKNHLPIIHSADANYLTARHINHFSTFHVVETMRAAGYTQDYFHADYVANSPFFRSSEWVQAVNRKFDGKRYLSEMRNLMPPASVYHLYGENFREETAKSAQATSTLRTKDFGENLAWAEIVHKNLVPEGNLEYLQSVLKIDEAMGDILKILPGGSDPLYFDPLTFQIVAPANLRPADAAAAALKSLRAYWIKNPKEHAIMKSIAQSIWRHREKYIYADFLIGKTQQFAWDVVTELIGIDRELANRELSGTLLRALRNQNAREMILLSFKLEKLADHQLSWLDLRSAREAQNIDNQHSYIRNRIYFGNPQIFREHLLKRMEESFKSGPREPDLIDNDLERAYFGMTGKSVYATGDRKVQLHAPVEDLIALAIWHSDWPLQTKRRILDERYLRSVSGKFNLAKGRGNSNDGGFSAHWSTHTEYDANLKVADVLMRAGLAHSVHQLFTAWNGSTRPREARFAGYRALTEDGVIYSQAVQAFEEPILKHVDSIATIRNESDRAAALIEAGQVYLRASPGHGSWSAFDKEVFRELRRRIITIALNTQMPLKRRISLFEILTSTASIPETDHYFKTAILPELEVMDAEGHRVLKRALTQQRFVSQAFAVSVAQRLLVAEASSLKKQITDDNIQKFLEKLNRLLPFDSPAKDELIELLSWRTEIQEDNLLLLMQAHKSVNWRRLNPQLVNWASFISENLRDLSRDEIKDLILYLADPHQRDFPKSLERALKTAVDTQIEEVVKQKRDANIHYSPEMIAELKEEALIKLREQFIKRAKDSSPTDRVPIFDLLLHSGSHPYSMDQNFPYNVIEQIMQLQRGSFDEIALRSWLETIPRADWNFEAPMSVAYRLSTMGSEKGSVRTGFELFGTVGKKTGQGASIFEVFESAATNEELADLKDSKRGLTKIEIKERIRKALGHDRFRLVDLLGAASIKTVALIQLENGEYRAANMLNEGARETLQMHIARAKLYVNRLAANGAETELELFNAYIEALEQSLPDELDLRIEVEKYKRMKLFFDETNLHVGGEWTFSVPEVDPTGASADFYMTTYAPGESYDELPEGPEKTSAGESIFFALARGLLIKGQFEPDRHHKNIKVETAKRIIHMLDPGQFEEFLVSRFPFQIDDRILLARFLTGVHSANVDVVMSALEGMGNLNGRETEVRGAIVEALNSSETVQGRSAAMIKTLHRIKYVMEFRFSFTALKGLMVLMKEKYVHRERGEEVLKELVTKILFNKMDVQTIRTQLPSLGECGRMLKELFSKPVK